MTGKGGKQLRLHAAAAAEPLAAWLAARTLAPGPLFCGVRKDGALTGQRLAGTSVRYIVQRAAEAAGLEACTPLDFRRTLVGDLLGAGAPIAAVQELVGHAHRSTTARYDRRPERERRPQRPSSSSQRAHAATTPRRYGLRAPGSGALHP